MARTLRHPEYDIVCIGGHDSRVLAQASGHAVREQMISVLDRAPVTRLLLQNSNGTKKWMVRGGRVSAQNMIGPFRDALEAVGASAVSGKVLVVSHAPVAKFLRGILSGDAGDLDEVETRLRTCLTDWGLRNPDWEIDVGTFFSTSGSGYTDYDACITLGDPWPDMDTAIRSQERSGMPSYRRCRQQCRKELVRVEALLGIAHRDKPALLVHTGSVAPEGWSFEEIDWRARGRGRPAAIGRHAKEQDGDRVGL